MAFLNNGRISENGAGAAVLSVAAKGWTAAMGNGVEAPAALTRDRRDEARAFLQRVFQAPPDAGFLNQELFDWKYFHPRMDCAWLESRSFVLFDGEQMAAHCGVWPLTLRNNGHGAPTVHLIDWGADSRYAGAGTTLYMQLARRADHAIVIGGAPQARKILPRIGFRVVGEMKVFHRICKPWEYHRAGVPGGGWQRTARLVRDGLLQLHPGNHRSFGRWSIEASSGIPAGLGSLVAEECDGWLRFEHSTDFLEYVLACPGMRWQVCLLYRQNQPEGYAVVSVSGGQARVVDFWIRGTDQERWKDAATLVCRFAARQSGVNQVLVAAASAFHWEIFGSLGLRVLSSKPVFLSSRDKRAPVPGIDRPLHLTMLDSDAFLLP